MIVVAGEALVDLVEADGVIHAVPGGGPFNTAIALGRLGVPVAYLGTLARDEYGDLLGQLLKAAGVDTSLVRFSEAPTPLAVVHKHADGTNSYTFYLAGTALTDVDGEALPALPPDTLALHVGTLALAVDPPGRAFRALVEREAGKVAIVFDPNVRPAVFGDADQYRPLFERLASLATIVKMSADDASFIYPGREAPAVLDHVLALGPRVVAVTLGADGAMAASTEGHVRLPAVPVAVADTVGSGDAFGAALVAALAAQGALALDSTLALNAALLEEAVGYATIAAAIASTRTGAVPPSGAEIAAWRSDGAVSRDGGTAEATRAATEPL